LVDQLLSFAGSDSPSAFVTVMSIGHLGVEENKKHSAAIAAELEKLGVASNRAYILFQDATASDVGFKGTTFADPSIWN
jgi:phenylpyruvate tautomerase